MTRRALVLCAAILGGVILTPRPASAWWESVVVTNSPAMTSQSYVTNGLIAMWDGIENAGVGIHDASATAWVDLSGNGNDYALYSGPVWEENCVYCGGSYGAGGIGAGIAMAQSVLTMECVAKADISDSASHCLVAKNSITSGSSAPCLIVKDGSRFEWGYYYDSSTSIANVLVSLSSTGSAGWVNGFSCTGNVTDTWGFNGNLSLMGDARNSSYNTKGRLFNVRAYDRALTAAEIAHNYAVDKQRFIDGCGNNPVLTTNRVYHANPPASAYDALSPWNAPERTRLGGDARTLRPSAIIKEN